MALKNEIEVVIRPDGSVTFEVKCAKGPSCMDLTRAIEESLGEVIERERTPDFYQEVEESEQIRMGN
ncbi:MAG: DUF2997 domain-containing protein [Myxococcota bacterium]